MNTEKPFWKTCALNLRDAAFAMSGFVPYILKGETPLRSYYSMLNLHSRTNGKTSSFFTKLLKIIDRKKNLNFPKGTALFSKLTDEQRKTVLRQLKEEGTSILPITLPSELCEKIRKKSLEIKAFPFDVDGKKIETKVLCDLNNPKFIRYQYDMSDLVTLDVVQDLMADPDLLSIVQDHFGFAPTIDLGMMWWSTAHDTSANTDFAQLFHFDYDRPKWLKLFIYFTDVGPENGPHVYVKHSHLSDERRASLLKKGYVRHSDDEVLSAYKPSEIVSFTGKAGTMILEDTSGFHKGTPLASGNRLLLDLQFSTTVYGSKYPQAAKPAQMTESLKQALEKHPELYKIFVS